MAAARAFALLVLLALAASPGCIAETRRFLQQDSKSRLVEELTAPGKPKNSGIFEGKAPKPAPTPKAGVTKPEAEAKAREPVSLDIAAAVFNATGLDKRLSVNASRATIFAPSDKAFEKLVRSLNLTNATDLLLPAYRNLSMAIAALHVIPGVALYAANISSTPTTVMTLSGDNITVMTTGLKGVVRIYVGGPNTTASLMGPPYGLGGEVAGNETAKVIRADMRFMGYIVHVIDKVLLPANATRPFDPMEQPEP